MTKSDDKVYYDAETNELRNLPRGTLGPVDPVPLPFNENRRPTRDLTTAACQVVLLLACVVTGYIATSRYTDVLDFKWAFASIICLGGAIFLNGYSHL